MSKNTCRLCEKELTDWEIHHYQQKNIITANRVAVIPGYQVCDTCAGIIANRYNFAHSGEFLTWDESLQESGK